MAAQLIYSTIASLDGYVADADGNFDWAAPDEEVHAFVNDLERMVGTYLYGRRMYETMVVWETMEAQPDLSPAMADYARIWRAAEKGRRLRWRRSPASGRGGAVRLHERPAEGGAERSRSWRRAPEPDRGGTYVDQLQVLIAAGLVRLGAGTRSLPGGVRLDLELLEERRFDNDMAFLRYAVER